MQRHRPRASFRERVTEIDQDIKMETQTQRTGDPDSSKRQCREERGEGGLTRPAKDR